jgi:hypothetical protein
MKTHTLIIIFLISYMAVFPVKKGEAKGKVIVTFDNKYLRYVNYKDTDITINFSNVNSMKVIEKKLLLKKEEILNSNYPELPDTIENQLIQDNNIVGKLPDIYGINIGDEKKQFKSNNKLYLVGMISVSERFTSILIKKKLIKETGFNSRSEIFLVNIKENKILSITRISNHADAEGTEIYSYSIRKGNQFVLRETYSGSDVINGHENDVRIYVSKFLIDNEGFVKLQNISVGHSEF